MTRGRCRAKLAFNFTQRQALRQDSDSAWHCNVIHSFWRAASCSRGQAPVRTSVAGSTPWKPSFFQSRHVLATCNQEQSSWLSAQQAPRPCQSQVSKALLHGSLRPQVAAGALRKCLRFLLRKGSVPDLQHLSSAALRASWKCASAHD